MKRITVCVALGLLSFCTVSALDAPRGHLFIIGGGERPADMMKKFVSLASACGSGRIVVFPMASSVPDEVGREQAEELEALGAKDVTFHILTREEALKPENSALLDGVGGVFFSGGVQTRLTDILQGTPLHQKLLRAYAGGAVIGGTSAGAAVMSEVMITGDERREVEEGREFSTLEADNIVTVPGLGFIKSAVIDQHFVRRKRHNRLISLICENTELLGIGIDESTAVWVKPDSTMEVVGSGCVLIYDASEASVSILPDRSFSSHNMVFHILKEGDIFDLGSGRVGKR
jgi:cyanophycinase